MIKKNWKTLSLTSIIILLPVIWALIEYDSIPEQIPTHFNISGEIDQYGHKAFLFFVPIITLLIEWAAAIEAHFRNKKKEFTAPYMQMMCWTCAGVSMAIGIVMYSCVHGDLLTAQKLIPIFVGVVFIIMGNLMPKFKKNKFAGLRVKWTLADSNVWFKTHRFCGRVAIVCGFLSIILALFDNIHVIYPILFILVLSTVLIPVLYSYILYNKKVDSNEKENR